MIDKENARQFRNQMQAAAFTAWLGGNGGDKSFDAYLRMLGLAEKERPISDDAKKRQLKKAKAVEQQIKDRLRRLKKRKK